ASLEVVSESGIISVRYTDYDQQRAADIANEYVNQLSLIINSVNVSNIKGQKEFLEKRLSEINKELKVASSKLTFFQVKNKMVDLQKQGDILISEIATIRTKIIMTEAEIDSLKTIYSSNSPKINMLEATLNSLREEL